MSKHLILTLLLCFLAFSCTERIDIKTDDAAPCLSVFGYITNKINHHFIKITYTAGYFTTEPPKGISNATVTISDGTNVCILTESVDSAGVYVTPPTFYAVEGKTYTLDISLDFDNDGVNEQYRATAYMPYATRVDTVILSPSKIPSTPNLLLFGKVPDIQENNLALYINKNSEKRNIFGYFLILTDSYFEGYDIDGYEFPCVVRDGIKTGDTIIFRVNSFSHDFSHFISHAKSEVGGSNPIFGGPPADVGTNIYALDKNNTVKIVGFFGAFPWDEKYTISDSDYQRPHGSH